MLLQTADNLLLPYKNRVVLPQYSKRGGVGRIADRVAEKFARPTGRILGILDFGAVSLRCIVAVGHNFDEVEPVVIGKADCGPDEVIHVAVHQGQMHPARYSRPVPLLICQNGLDPFCTIHMAFSSLNSLSMVITALT
ncbi:hypothetical protein D3C76_1091890 [compost metagenome]